MSKSEFPEPQWQYRDCLGPVATWSILQKISVCVAAATDIEHALLQLTDKFSPLYPNM